MGGGRAGPSSTTTASEHPSPTLRATSRAARRLRDRGRMEPVFSREARATSGTSDAVERAARHGILEQIRPGAYAPAGWRAAPEREQHLVKVRAAARVLSNDTVFSHESAAAVHGIPVFGAWPDSVRASYEGPHGRSARAGLRWARASWEEGDVVRSAGILVTSPRRTAIDLARTGSLAQGVAALDHVIAGGTDRAELLTWVARRRPFHGVVRMERALRLAHGLSESPLESLSLARIAELEYALPVQQHMLLVDGAPFRLDFFWPHGGIAGEADGRLKYADRTDLWREKRREDRIRRVVRAFVRWSWSDAWHPERLDALLSAAGVPRV
jgi:hypothetical protein